MDESKSYRNPFYANTKVCVPTKVQIKIFAVYLQKPGIDLSTPSNLIASPLVKTSNFILIQYLPHSKNLNSNSSIGLNTWGLYNSPIISIL